MENNQGYNPGANQQPQYQAPQQPQYQQPQYQAPQQPQYQQPQYQPQYQQPQYQYQQPQKPNDGKGLSIAALVLGIVGVVFCWVGGLNIVVLALCILGIIFGSMGRKKSIEVYGKASGMATAGLVLGIIGTAFAALGVVACVACTGCFSCPGCASGCIEGAVDSMYYDMYDAFN